MKKIVTIFGLAILLMACNNEPKLNQQEENAVEDQLAKDQDAMDSLERAIKAQIGEEEIDSL